MNRSAVLGGARRLTSSRVVAALHRGLPVAEPDSCAATAMLLPNALAPVAICSRAAAVRIASFVMRPATMPEASSSFLKGESHVAAGLASELNGVALCWCVQISRHRRLFKQRRCKASVGLQRRHLEQPSHGATGTRFVSSAPSSGTNFGLLFELSHSVSVANVSILEALHGLHDSQQFLHHESSADACSS